MACLSLGADEIDYLSLQRRIIDIHQKNQETVFKVIAAFNPEDTVSKPLLFVGTGFAISRDGHVLTNTNVTLGADRVWVERDSVVYTAEQVGYDPMTNISVIRILEPPADLKFLRLNESTERPPIGSILVALTCEIGLEPGPTMGVVKGWNISYGKRTLPTVYLRTDIAADGGEGGGPVFDLNGNLVGMMVVALPEIRSSFTLPIKAVSRVINDILLTGQVTYAYFGFGSHQVSDTAAGVRRILVEDVDAGSPAELAGLMANDELVKIGDYAIEDHVDLRLASFYIRPDQNVPIVVNRNGRAIELAMQVGVRESPDSAVPPSQMIALPDDEPTTHRSKVVSQTQEEEAEKSDAAIAQPETSSAEAGS